MRIQLALNVKDLEAAVDFYSKMFGVKVNKRKPGYANFAIDEPPLKLVLFESPDADESLNHLGVEVFADEEVAIAADRAPDGWGLTTSVLPAAIIMIALQTSVSTEWVTGVITPSTPNGAYSVTHSPWSPLAASVRSISIPGTF